MEACGWDREPSHKLTPEAIPKGCFLYWFLYRNNGQRIFSLWTQIKKLLLEIINHCESNFSFAEGKNRLP